MCNPRLTGNPTSPPAEHTHSIITRLIILQQDCSDGGISMNSNRELMLSLSILLREEEREGEGGLEKIRTRKRRRRKGKSQVELR